MSVIAEDFGLLEDLQIDPPLFSDNIRSLAALVESKDPSSIVFMGKSSECACRLPNQSSMSRKANTAS